ncbi:MAG TPA: sigma-70 family RNA polymerase sigma factor [Puia sp.]|nr:sigma-70 family RNA polymerase sigma factor [Puia sp.]
MNNDTNKVIDRFRGGDRISFRVIYELLCPELTSFSYVITGSEEDAKEIFVDTMEKLWDHRSEMGSMEHVRRFCYVVIRNASISYLRRRRPDMPYGDVIGSISENDWGANLGDSAAKEIVYARMDFREMLEAAKEEIEHLPAGQRSIFRLMLAEKSAKEISEELGIAVNTVYTQRNAGREKLREALAQKGFDVSILSLIWILWNL